MKVYAFEWCDCVFESGYSIQSLHATKAGAYKAMKRTLFERWNESRWGCSGRFKPNDTPLIYESWRVRTIEVLS